MTDSFFSSRPAIGEAEPADTGGHIEPVESAIHAIESVFDIRSGKFRRPHSSCIVESLSGNADGGCARAGQKSPARFFCAAPNSPRRAETLAPARYNSRRAVATGSRAARMAGSRPPMRPMMSANKIPFASNSGVILKAKARLEKV